MSFEKVVVTVDKLAVISHEFDQSFSHAAHGGFEQLQSSLATTRIELLNRFQDDDVARLEVRRSELDRLLVGGIHNMIDVADCLELYSARSDLGFDGIVDRWLTAHILIKYGLERAPESRTAIADICESIEPLLEGLLSVVRRVSWI